MTNKPTIVIGQSSEAGRKAQNEDSFGTLIPDEPLLTTKGIAIAIADGMSGGAAGKEASENCVKSLLSDYFCTHESWSVETSVARVLTAVNRWLCSQGQFMHPTSWGMVSTLSTLILKSGTAHIFHIGDSRIYRFRDGGIELLTQDHRMGQTQDRIYLSRAMGIEPNVKIDYRQISVEAGDVFVFTTDGVHDHLSDTEISAFLRPQADDLDVTARNITTAALNSGSQDNLTCQIVRVEHPGTEDESAYTLKLQALPFPPDLGPGMVLDGYRILRELHASPRSQVYLAIDIASDANVVIKTPSVNFEDDAAYIEQFTREEWIGRRLDSPHVLKVIPPKQRRQFLYSVTEYVEGQTLRQWMDDHPQQDLPMTRGIVKQIAIGLRAFHRDEMIHQDLKPENIVIDRHGTVKIIDFGSVRVAGLEEIPSPIERHATRGTVGYTAPETILDQRPTERADIFSLGVIAYEMLTGKHPYGGGFSSRRDVERRKYVPARQYNRELPAWVAAALTKAVQRDPEKRYEVLSEFVTDLAKPNPAFLRDQSPPLIERNPLAFWRGLSLILVMVVLALLYAVFALHQ